jgi:hypothetical protein
VKAGGSKGGTEEPAPLRQSQAFVQSEPKTYGAGGNGDISAAGADAPPGASWLGDSVPFSIHEYRVLLRRMKWIKNARIHRNPHMAINTRRGS